VDGKQVALLRHTVVETWPAMAAWQNLSVFLERVGHAEFASVKVSSYGRFSDADRKAPLHSRPGPGWRATFQELNLSRIALEERLKRAADSQERLVYFAEMTASLQADVMPDKHLYLTADDWMYRRQFVW
jgi:hypothetical protein